VGHRRLQLTFGASCSSVVERATSSATSNARHRTHDFHGASLLEELATTSTMLLLTRASRESARHWPLQHTEFDQCHLRRSSARNKGWESSPRLRWRRIPWTYLGWRVDVVGVVAMGDVHQRTIGIAIISCPRFVPEPRAMVDASTWRAGVVTVASGAYLRFIRLVNTAADQSLLALSAQCGVAVSFCTWRSGEHNRSCPSTVDGRLRGPAYFTMMLVRQ